MSRLAIITLATIALVSTSVTVRASVLGFTVDKSTGDTILTCVVIDNDTGPVAYDASKLVGGRLTHFKSTHNRNVVQSVRVDVPDGATRRTLLADRKLNTGIINPGSSAKPLGTAPVLTGPESTPGMAVIFDPPVTNRLGDDVVLFEIQRGDSPHSGDAFHIGPLESADGRKAITVTSFDVGFDHPSACSVDGYIPFISPRSPGSLNDLCDAPLQAETSPGGFKVLAVGVDLSDLGFADGETVTGLFLQDAGSPNASVDPVLIAGLLAPVPPNVLAEVPELPQHKPDPTLSDLLDGPLAATPEIVFAERIPELGI